jgi:hypothetical protein
MAYRLEMQHTIPMNIKRIHNTRIGTAPECRNCADQIAIGMTIRNPVPTMASVASESNSVARACTLILSKFGSWTIPAGIVVVPSERIGASIKACIAAEPQNVRQ